MIDRFLVLVTALLLLPFFITMAPKAPKKPFGHAYM
jgi:hypothetical protein